MRKIKFWQLWDWESIVRVVMVLVFICGVGVVMFCYPGWIREYQSKEMTAITDGKCIRSEYVEQTHQGRYGNKDISTDLIVQYAYTVNGKIYYAEDKVPISIQNNLFLKALNEGSIKTFKIDYNPDKPEKSKVHIGE